MMYSSAKYATRLLVAIGIISFLLYCLVFILEGKSDRSSPSVSILSKPSFDFRPADNKLTSEVENAVVIRSSYAISPKENYYQLHVIIDEQARFVPIGIQLINPDTHTPMANIELFPAPNLKCWDRLSYKEVEQPAYQTQEFYNLSANQISRIIHDRSYQVNLFVENNDGLFLVTGLRFSDQCSGAII